MTDLDPFNISYGVPNSGVYGYFVSDRFEVNGVTAQHIDIAVATISHPGDPPGGIMGIGMDARQSLGDHGRGNNSYPGYVDQLVMQELINVRVYSLYLDDQTYAGVRTGSILFGGYDPSKYTGDLVPLPIVDNPAEHSSLSVNWSSISVSFGHQITKLDSASLPYPALLDSGTSIVGVPPSIFAELITFFPSVHYDNATDNWLVDCNTTAIDGTVDFGFQGSTGAVTIAVAYREFVELLGEGTCGFGIQPAPPPLDPLFLVLGELFLRSAYTLFNLDAGTISLAQLDFTSHCEDCAIVLERY